MNILIPHTWLLEHLDTQATPQDIQKYLSLSGPSVERIYEKNSHLLEGEGQGEVEFVYDIEVTTNRVDSMCVRGIAREAAVILTQAGFPSQLKPLQKTSEQQLTTNTRIPLPTIHSNPDLSRRIMCVVLEIDRNTTPNWMAARLTQIEENVHDAAIDITNYITHELGHPCHAFDYDRIMALGGVINVTQATPGMPFTTLDGNTYETLGGEVVFTNDKNEIIDLPGIKGTANSAVNPTTKRILFWFESIPASLIRQASMSHNIRTVAAQLFEKNVDPSLAEDTLNRGIQLYQQLCNAKVVSEIYNNFPNPNIPTAIQVSPTIIETYLGIHIPSHEVIQILESLECIVKQAENDYFITPPSFRPDLTMPVDIVEEIARMYGYHNLPSTLMSGAIPTTKPQQTDFDLESKIKNHLASSGWQEVYTYSLVSEDLKKSSVFPIDNYDSKNYLKLNNPLTDDRVYLRQSLIPSLSEVLDQNPTYQTLSVFEIANVYHPQNSGLPQENLHLTLVTNLPYRQLITQVYHLLHKLYISDISTTQKPGNAHAIIQNSLHTKNESHHTTGNKNLLGTITALPNNRFAIDFIFTDLIAAAHNHPTLNPSNQFPPIIQDFTLELTTDTLVGDIIEKIQHISPLIAQVEYLDSYENKHTFRVYFQSDERNLQDSDITLFREKIQKLAALAPAQT